MKRTLIRITLAALLAILALAQDFRAKVQGIVTDSTRAAIAGATVTLSNLNTGVKTVRQSNETGLYRFDYVDPGTYSIQVEMSGFSRFFQDNFPVQAQADITVNATLTLGAVQESVTVNAAPVSVQFNSANVTLTVDTKLATDLPRFDRNPFKLSLLNPAVVETRRGEMNPYHSWAGNSLELGGGTDKKNDLQVDGSPVGVGYKTSYVPNTDSIQEVNVQQNSVDAESGHSAGGAINMTLRSGTNEFHGTAFYLGRNPALNAVTDRTTGNFIAARTNIWGATLGNPIRKNKLFSFFSYEHWRPRTPGTFLSTMPTALEKQGDFSQSLNTNGTERTVFNPYSTVFDAATGRATRTPFPGNRIPSSQFDPVATRIMNGLYAPNRQPDNVTGLNNFFSTTKSVIDYWNISERADWFINEKWKVNGRYSRFHTDVSTDAPILTKSEIYVPSGSFRHSRSISGDAIWTIDQRTVVNFHGDYHNFVDQFASPDAELKEGLGKFWPNSQWFKPYETKELPTFIPRLRIGGTTMGSPGTLWSQHPNGNAFSAKISQQRGAHFLKAGMEARRAGGYATTTTTSVFTFTTALTADTFLNPNTRLYGNEFATLLLGALSNDSTMVLKPIKRPRTEFYGAFLQDDYKLNRRITLNLGLRWEYESPWHDPPHNMSIGPDLTQPIPEMQQTPPRIPAQAAALLPQPHSFTGAWIFTSNERPGVWSSQKAVFAPRVGVAVRVDDRTALRFGYARYVTPAEYNFVGPPYAGFEALNFIEPPYMGFDALQSPPPLAEGIPQSGLLDPFPTSNPLIAPVGKSNGRYYGLGIDNVVWAGQNFTRPVNDRLNLTISRQLPGGILAEVTYFANFGHNLLYSWNQNQIDPRVGYAAKGVVDTNVANPFYQYLTPDKFPGPLRNQPTVALKTLLVKYPQYGGLWEAYRSGKSEQYRSFQVKVQKPFTKGYNFLFGYNYIRERDEQFFDDIASYLNTFNWQESNQPHHRVTVAGTYEFPFGRGRAFLNQLPRAADAALGGWQVVGAWYFNSGNYLRFGSMLNYGDPGLDNPTPAKWFDTSKFAILPAYTPRTNLWQFPNVRGPIYWELQATLSKTFHITERYKTELKMAAYNATNRLNWADPSTDVISSTFGQTLRQATSTGRQIEIGLKILF